MFAQILELDKPQHHSILADTANFTVAFLGVSALTKTEQEGQAQFSLFATFNDVFPDCNAPVAFCQFIHL